MNPNPSRRQFLGSSFAALGAVALPAAGFAAATPTSSAPAAPPKKNLNNPYVYRFNIGAIEAWSISDGHLLFNDRVDKMWPPDRRDAMVRELEAHGERTDGIPLYVNVLVLRKGREVVLCDAGFGLRTNPNIGWLADGLASIGISPGDVTHTILSHGHSDHIGGFVTSGRPTFPNAGLHVLKAEVDFWRSAQPDFSKSHRRDNIPNMIRSVRESFDALQSNLVLHQDGDAILGGAIAIESAPGHTDGHCVLRIRDGGETLVHLMDVAHNHVLMFADPAWFIEFDHDPEVAVAVRQRLFARLAASRERCYGFHLPWPGIGRVLPRNPGYRWEPERFSWGS
jgi:glyoxylase-like metal-dependent hydrolase (beta-lactamase superfamily II)